MSVLAVWARRFRVSGAFYGLAGLGVMLFVWYVATTITTRSQVPTITASLEAIRSGWHGIAAVQFYELSSGGIGQAVASTTWHVVAGVAAGSVAGVVVGVVFAQFPTVRAFGQPLLVVGGTIPLMVLLPFMLIWFGTSPIAQTGLVVIFAFITVAVAVQHSATETEAMYGGYARSLGASATQVRNRVVIPATIPSAVAAIRVSLAAGWGWQCVAELIGGKQGAGRIIKATANIGAVDSMFGVLLCIVVVALIVDCLVVCMANLVTRWRE